MICTSTLNFAQVYFVCKNRQNILTKTFFQPHSCAIRITILQNWLLIWQLLQLWAGDRFFEGTRKYIKGQLSSEWIYEVIVSLKMQTKNYKYFCPTKQTRIVAKKTAYNHQKITKKSAILVCLIGQKSLKFLVFTLGETLTS